MSPGRTRRLTEELSAALEGVASAERPPIPPKPEIAAYLQRGTFSGVVFECDDIRTTYEELRDRGVEFTEEPTLQSWGGIQAQFKEQDGNGFVLVRE